MIQILMGHTHMHTQRENASWSQRHVRCVLKTLITQPSVSKNTPVPASGKGEDISHTLG